MRVLHILCITALLATTGCAGGPTSETTPDLPHAMPVNPPEGSNLLTFNTFAGDALQKMLLLRMDSGGGILTASFVDLHDFNKTSAFGRVTSQQVASRLGQYGFRIIEARLAGELAMIPGPGGNAGEFMLSRETARLLADTYDASAVLVGCYSDYGNTIFVSARVVRLADNTVMGAYEYFVPRDPDVRLLLSGSTGRGVSGGDGVWARHAIRDQAFAPGSHDAGSDVRSPRAGTGRPHSARSEPVNSSRPVPRAVLQNPPSETGPVAAAKPKPKPAAPPAASPVVAPAPAAQEKVAPVTLQEPAAPVAPAKDTPAPVGTPGGQ